MSLPGFFLFAEGCDTGMGAPTQEASSALASCSSHVGADAPGLRELVAESCVSGQLSAPSSKKQALEAKAPGRQIQSSLHKLFKQHRKSRLTRKLTQAIRRPPRSGEARAPPPSAGSGLYLLHSLCSPLKRLLRYK